MKTEIEKYSAKQIAETLVAIFHQLDKYSETNVDAGATRLTRPDPSTTGDSWVARMDVERAYQYTHLLPQELDALYGRLYWGYDWTALGRIEGVTRQTAKARHDRAIEKMCIYLNGEELLEEMEIEE